MHLKFDLVALAASKPTHSPTVERTRRLICLNLPFSHENHPGAKKKARAGRAPHIPM